MSMINASSLGFSAEERPKVVVIGAGIAGLTAAYRLHNAGVDVHLYEARNRVGGRIFSVSVGGNIAELGAQNITDGGEAPNIHSLINEFGLELVRHQVNLNHSYFDGEKLIPIRELLNKKQFNPSTLRKQLNDLLVTSHNMKELLDGIIEQKDLLNKVISVRLAAYEGAPPEKLSTFYVETLFHMLLGGICSVHQGIDKEEESHVELVSIKGGNSLLSERIAQLLGPRLHLNMPLIQVVKDENELFALTFSNGQKVKADILILAIPCSVYEDITFGENIFAAGQLNSIQNVQYGTNSKILIPFSGSPKRKTGVMNNRAFASLMGENVLTLYYTGQASVFCNETLLETYNSDKLMIEMGFEKEYLSTSLPMLAKGCVFENYDSVGYSWPNDPYVKGSYSYIAPGQENILTAIKEEQVELFKTVFAPINKKLYFAGEHTSVLMEVPGTMEAACESGERIARAVLKNL